MEFRLLILPAGSEIALELRVLFQLRIAVGREHLAVGVDVDVLSVGLLEQQLHVVQVVTAHNDERTFLDGERHLRRNRVAVGFSVGVVEQLHAFQVDGSGLEHQREQHVLRLVLAVDEHGIIELGAQSTQRFQGAAIVDNKASMLGGYRLHGTGEGLPDAGKLTAGDHNAVGIDDAEGAGGAFLELQYDALKNTTRHNCSFLPLQSSTGCTNSPK